MIKVIEGELSAKGIRFAIVASRFNRFISERLLEGAIDCIAKIAYETGTPTSFGIITADSTDQAMDRAGLKSGNKGWDAALSAIEMVNLLKKIK
ncbi:MAG: hypothetical protein B5M53_10790 [Candidatus Cloacimonas sp. 4484_209]|nr:MAG: hypothetical protein B5M53_10790 [Candidatus Cloacimonas sp. 4484_209]